MKNFLLTLSFIIFSSSSFATGNFNSETGSLIIRNLNVDGTTTYDSVNVQLNLTNGTFTILEATPELRTPAGFFSQTVMDTLVQDNIKIDFMGCIITDKDQFTGKMQITCKTQVISLIETQEIHVLGTYSSVLVDNLGNEYKLRTVVALDLAHARAGVDFNAIQGVPVTVKFIYDDVDSSASSISAFKPVFYPIKLKVIEANFKDTDTLSPFK